MTALPATQTIETREQLETLLENIAHLHAARAELRAAEQHELDAVRARYRAPLAELDAFLNLETGWAEMWARRHPEAFTAGGELVTTHATLGFRSGPPRLARASRRWTWSRIARVLPTLPWAAAYLRTPEPVVDHDAILADAGKLSAEQLRTAGLRVEQGERFFLTPHSAHSESDPRE
jgi:phage host-nuclease inhibitor protein Gam